MATGVRSNPKAATDADTNFKVNSLHDSTSEFDKGDINKLRITYKCFDNVATFRELVYNGPIEEDINSSLFIKHLHYKDFIGCSRDANKVSGLSNKEKHFAILVDQIALNETVIRGTEESKTDTFVDYVLRESGLADYPLTLRLKPLYELTVRHKKISSVYDFSVEKDNIVLLVEEDKHIRNTTLGAAWGEYQIAGEILAGAYNNYVLNATESELITIRVISTQFTFYHTRITLEYLNSLAMGLPTEDAIIFRYPDSNLGLDYKDPNDRKKIISVLMSIKSNLLAR